MVSGRYGVGLERWVRSELKDDDGGSDMVDCCECGSVRISILGELHMHGVD